MTKVDIRAAFFIGAGVGLLLQFIINNFAEVLISAFNVSIIFIRVAAFLFFLFLAPSLLFLASLIGKYIPVVYQFAKFAAVGSLNSMIDLGVFNLETFLLGHLPTTTVFSIFKAISFIAATTNSFFWNKFWTFESKTKIKTQEAAKFYAVAISGGLINVYTATLVKQSFSAFAFVSANFWVNIVAPLSGVVAALIWDFLGYKFFVFRKKEPDENEGVSENM